ncbi:MAG TPA: NAD-dependent epimerase/dehydratase family protein [Flavobacterium sp.]|nr:NAD-dependent epimerase/dehydratase family protein [Flavobacterium sp.]
MKLLVIGSKGFIGQHTVNYFKDKHNYEVYGADVIPNNDSKYYQLNDITPDFEHIFEKHKFDVCINASGNGSVPISINQPIFDFELNTTNTIKILDSIRKNAPACKFINLSSAAVYGNPEVIPVKENAELKPLSPYGWHKLYAEQLCREYFYLYNIKTINLRLFSVYGEGLRKQLFWDIYQKSKRSKVIELFGSGVETRDFIYIKDLLKAMEVVVERGLFNGESVNVGSGKETTIAHAASIFCEAVSEGLKLRFNKITKPGDPLNWQADISVIQSFGFKPTTAIEDGMKNTALWLIENT